MYIEKKIAVIIPCYNVSKFIKQVIETLPEFIDYVIAVDDKCPSSSGKITKDISISNKKVYTVFHKVNKGVGAAVVSGYLKALELGADIMIKMDGDAQMDPKYIESLILPIVENKADYTKGNRFSDFKALRSMPKVRIFGNSVLSFMLKTASGYWDMMDPTNGYTAIHKNAIKKLDTDTLAKRYFFESDMLINLNIENCVVKDVPIPALYGAEESSLNIANVLMKFPPKIFLGLLKRIAFKYFIYSFNIASIYIFFGGLMTMFGLSFGVYKWIVNSNLNIETPTGTVMLAVLPLILGIQLILQAITIDLSSIPKK